MCGVYPNAYSLAGQGVEEQQVCVPPLLNHTWPHALKMGNLPVEDKGLFPISLALLSWGLQGRQNMKTPLKISGREGSQCRVLSDGVPPTGVTSQLKLILGARCYFKEYLPFINP